MNAPRSLHSWDHLQKIIEAAIESAYEGLVITDPDGYILLLNRTYCRFLEVDPDEVIGKHVTEVIENTRMHIVGKTGKAEWGQVQIINGSEALVHRIPIYHDSKVVAVVGKVLFQDVQKLHALSQRVKMLNKELAYYKEEYMKRSGLRHRLQDIIGSSPAMKMVKEMIRKVAGSTATVFINGESGTGKEMVAHAIHFASPRQKGPFVKVNCAAIPENLMESILFGYAEGAFTGAIEGGRKGKFEMADGGTIFLDEIGELPLSMQAKLLRVLQEKEVEPVGSVYPKSVDVRILAASNRDLEKMVRNQRFRSDLYYRLNVVTLTLPPLRERMEDFPELVEHILKECSKEMGIYVKEVSDEAMACLCKHHWPGNVRELRNVLERTLHFMDGHVIEKHHLPDYLKNSEVSDNTLFPLKNAIAKAEKEAIQFALKITEGDRDKAIQLLGISRSGFYQKLKKYGIELED